MPGYQIGVDVDAVQAPDFHTQVEVDDHGGRDGTSGGAVGLRVLGIDGSAGG